MKYEKLVVSILLGLSLTSAKAQQATVTSGGVASGTNGNTSYSVGQIVYSSSGSTGTVSQGLQQPYEFFTLGTDNFPNISLQMVVYPNPTANSINLKIENLTSTNLEYQLFDLAGRKIAGQKISQTETQISLETFPSSTYFIYVSDNSKTIKSFKIIKNNL